MEERLGSVPSTPRKKRTRDRFIPNRSAMDLSGAFSLAGEARSPSVTNSEVADQAYSEVLKAELFGTELPSSAASTSSWSSPQSSIGSSPDRKNRGGRRETQSLPTTPRKNRNLFSYSPSKRATRATENEVFSSSPMRLDSQLFLLSPKKRPREIERTPYKALDAPMHADDFYLNLLEWGPQNYLAVGLGSSVYIWNRETEEVHELCQLDTDKVCSVSWINTGTHLAVGTQDGLVQIWDVENSRCIRQMRGHTRRVMSLSWNSHVLSSGSEDTTILHHDVRSHVQYTHQLKAHRGQVCGLRWNTELNQLASGANDDKVFIWDGMSQEPLYEFSEHRGAVKALAWSPHNRGLLATGGGTYDRRLIFWNTLTGQRLSEFDTGSQVCNVLWSAKTREIVSSHGFSNYQIAIWQYPSMQQVVSLTGHQSRVLSLSLSHDGEMLASGAGDETVRLWNIYQGDKTKDGDSRLSIYSQLR